MKKTLKYIIICVVVAGLMTGSFFGGYFLRAKTDQDIVSLKFVLDTYKKYYLEESDDYIRIMAESLLDRYSAYYSKEDYEILQKTAKGERAGIGVSFYSNTSTIASVNGNSPAENAGVKAGGTIVGITYDGKDYEITDYSSLSETLSPIEKDVEFTVKIDYSGEISEYVLKKAEYNETFVKYMDENGAYRFADSKENVGQIEFTEWDNGEKTQIPRDVGYIKFSAFNGQADGLFGAVGQIKYALDKFKKDGRSKLIFDLRNNGGGYISIMRDIASHLIKGTTGEKQVVAKAIYKDASVENFYTGKVDYDSFGYKQIVFIANANSASASEALMGAVFDYDEDDIVKLVLEPFKSGDAYIYRTYGKGIMQTTFINNGVGDALRLTTAKIYWPVSIKTIHGVGLTKSLLGDKCVEAEPDKGDYALKTAIKLTEKIT